MFLLPSLSLSLSLSLFLYRRVSQVTCLPCPRSHGKHLSFVFGTTQGPRQEHAQRSSAVIITTFPPSPHPATASPHHCPCYLPAFLDTQYSSSLATPTILTPYSHDTDSPLRTPRRRYYFTREQRKQRCRESRKGWM
ncbi:hypothetical protein E2C01_081715 [Portunus trituberculatus]|uniref:Secreted protein n=1 Tax=Portunus trituberculatus TaxID=210409 RepID=A0A5B7IZL3_PORTR|nr:hypothetical protein [Portunus trituberculatus]